jgi:hypothetical protein
MVKRKTKKSKKKKIKVRGRTTIDYNALGRMGIYFCASCGKRMKRYHYSGHCKKCLDAGVG